MFLKNIQLNIESTMATICVLEANEINAKSTRNISKNIFRFVVIYLRLAGISPQLLTNFDDSLSHSVSNFSVGNYMICFTYGIYVLFTAFKLFSHLLVTETLSAYTLENTLGFLQLSANLVTVIYILRKQQVLISVVNCLLKKFDAAFTEKSVSKIGRYTMYYCIFILTFYILYAITVIYRFSTHPDKKVDDIFRNDFDFLPEKTYSNLAKRFSVSVYFLVNTYVFCMCTPNIFCIIVICVLLVFDEIFEYFVKIVEEKNVTDMNVLISKIHSLKSLLEMFENYASLPLFMWYSLSILSLVTMLPAWLLIMQKGFITGLGNFTFVVFLTTNFCIISFTISGIQINYSNFISNLRKYSLSSEPRSEYFKLCEQFSQLASMKFELEVCGFFVVNRSFVLTVMSGVVTFAILIRQFAGN